MAASWPDLHVRGALTLGHAPKPGIILFPQPRQVFGLQELLQRLLALELVHRDVVEFVLRHDCFVAAGADQTFEFEDVGNVVVVVPLVEGVLAVGSNGGLDGEQRGWHRLTSVLREERLSMVCQGRMERQDDREREGQEEGGDQMSLHGGLLPLNSGAGRRRHRIRSQAGRGDSGWLVLLRLRAVLFRHGVPAIRQVHHALRVGPAIELTVTRRLKPALPPAARLRVEPAGDSGSTPMCTGSSSHHHGARSGLLDIRRRSAAMARPTPCCSLARYRPAAGYRPAAAGYTRPAGCNSPTGRSTPEPRRPPAARRQPRETRSPRRERSGGKRGERRTGAGRRNEGRRGARRTDETRTGATRTGGYRRCHDPGPFPREIGRRQRRPA